MRQLWIASVTIAQFFFFSFFLLLATAWLLYSSLRVFVANNACVLYFCQFQEEKWAQEEAWRAQSQVDLLHSADAELHALNWRQVQIVLFEREQLIRDTENGGIVREWHKYIEILALFVAAAAEQKACIFERRRLIAERALEHDARCFCKHNKAAREPTAR